LIENNEFKNNAYTHLRQPEYKKAFVGPDNRRLSMLNEEYGEDFLEEFRRSQRKKI